MAGERVKIEFQRSGGFAGITLRTRVDSAELPSEEASRLDELLAEVEQAGTPVTAAPERGVDRFQYDISIARDGEERRLTVGDGDLTPPLRALVDYLLECARRR